MYGSSLERSCAKLILVGETAVASVSREVLRGEQTNCNHAGFDIIFVLINERTLFCLIIIIPAEYCQTNNIFCLS